MPGTSGYYDARKNPLIPGLSLRVRTKVYELFSARFADAVKVLDAGVTSERESIEANFFEKLFPHKDRITAAGTEDAAFLEKEYPGLVFKRIEPGAPLPFGDDAFDVAFCHAVIEHVVEPEARRFFVSELIRVAKSVFLTTPSRFFPVETHTFIPLLHVLAPRLFYSLLDKKVLSKFYNSRNLRLLSRKDLEDLLGAFPGVSFKIEKVRLFGFTSNLVAIIDKPQKYR
ncbi:MAG: methyltransferase domain-containing protein [Elusimicrobiota bacterium]